MAAITTEYSSDQRVCTVRTDVTSGDALSDKFAMPGFIPVMLTLDGATGGATYSLGELQCVTRSADPDAVMTRVPGASGTANGNVSISGASEAANYRLSGAVTAGTLRLTATFVKSRSTIM